MPGKTKQAKAEDLGRAAYQAGLQRIPAWDPAFCRDYLKPNPMTGIRRMDLGAAHGWMKGWDQAKLDAEKGA